MGSIIFLEVLIWSLWTGSNEYILIRSCHISLQCVNDTIDVIMTQYFDYF